VSFADLSFVNFNFFKFINYSKFS